MRKLLRSNLRRLAKSKVFWGCSFTLLAYSELILISTYTNMVRYNESLPLDSVFFASFSILGVILSIVLSLFTGTEYNDGTIRNKIIIGRTRNQIYLSSFLTCAAAAIFICFTTLFLTDIVGLPLMGQLKMPGSTLRLLLLDGLLLCTAYGAIFNLIGMLSSSKAHTAVISILAAFALLFIGVWIAQALFQPEMTEALVTGDQGETAIQMIDNPRYLTGVERDIYQFFYDFLPGGQCMQFTWTEVAHPWLLTLYSAVITLLCNIAGLFIFNRKDIK